MSTSYNIVHVSASSCDYTAISGEDYLDTFEVQAQSGELLREHRIKYHSYVVGVLVRYIHPMRARLRDSSTSAH